MENLNLSFMGITEASVLMFGVPLVLAMVAIEVLVASARNTRVYHKGDTLGSLGLLAGNIVVSGLVKALAVGVYLVAYEYRLFNFSETLPPWLLLIVAFFLVDLAFYIWHRAAHRVRFLWAVHMSHHSSEEFNFVVSLRQAWLSPLLKIPFFAVLPFIGLDPSVLLVVGAMATLYGVWTHTRVVPKLGFLEGILATPSAHRVHHGSNPEYIDKNYANMFIFIDRIFGTYEPENNEVKYGLTKNLKTFNPFTITIAEWKKIWADLKTARSLAEVFGYVFGPPGWQPEDINSKRDLTASERN